PRQPRLGEAGLAKFSLAALDRWPALEREREPLASAEEVAMFPEGLPAKALGPEAFARRIAEAAADRAPLALGQRHGDRQPAFGIERLRVSDFHGREQPAVDQRAPGLVDLASVERLANLPRKACLHEGGIERLQALDGRRSEAGIWSGIDAPFHRHAARRVI